MHQYYKKCDEYYWHQKCDYDIKCDKYMTLGKPHIGAKSDTYYKYHMKNVTNVTKNKHYKLQNTTRP